MCTLSTGDNHAAVYFLFDVRPSDTLRQNELRLKIRTACISILPLDVLSIRSCYS
jgi:hypothetical protein